MNSESTTDTADNTSARPFRLIRSTDESKLAGICAGVAASSGIDVGALRVLVAVLTLLHPPVALVYLACWALLPAVPTRASAYAAAPPAENPPAENPPAAA